MKSRIRLLNKSVYTFYLFSKLCVNINVLGRISIFDWNVENRNDVIYIQNLWLFQNEYISIVLSGVCIKILGAERVK